MLLVGALPNRPESAAAAPDPGRMARRCGRFIMPVSSVDDFGAGFAVSGYAATTRLGTTAFAIRPSARVIVALRAIQA